MMTERDTELRRLNPVDLEDVERVTNRPIFDELGRSLLGGDTGSNTEGEADLPRIRRRAPYRRPAVLSAVAATILAVVGLVVFVGGSSGLARPVTTPWHSGHPFAVTRKPASHKEGSWRLVDDLLSGTWEQNTAGPPPGYLDCPSTSACYVMSGHYPDAMAGAPLLSESLYVSTDLGSTWSVLPMPRGFAPTTPLACGGPSDCAAGGTYNGQPVLVTTSDGGHTFTIDPLPGGIGTPYQLSCPTSRFCGGLVATSANDSGVPIDATFLSTNDDGATFTDAPIEAGDSMQEIACTTDLDCTVVGTNDAVGMNDWTAGVAAVTTDGGRSWATGALPAGFGVSYLSTLSCADARHCSLTGDIAITVQNPPECATLHTVPDVHPPTTTLPTSKTVPSAAVQAISNVESKLASEANLQAAKSNGGFSCVGTGSSAKTYGGDIATTTDGGRTWTPDQLPTDVPQPEFSGLTCPTETECWASGSEAVFQQIGDASNGGSSMLLGTNDAGQTWSKATFTVPSTAPNYDGQSYLSIHSISCATADVCAAVGAAAQGSPTAPVYSLVVPDGG
jgi:photosystem II stability/assembly factor-like uncharacterized protein